MSSETSAMEATATAEGAWMKAGLLLRHARECESRPIALLLLQYSVYTELNHVLNIPF
jgi:hypothetical protein